MSRLGTLLELLAAPALLAFGVGCGSNLQAMKTGVAAGGPMLAFWPPPEPTSVWTAPSTRAGANLASEATRIAEALRAAGYRDERWYSIGARYEHGFAVTTRLERMDGTGAPAPEDGRWSSEFPDAANLFWLEGARAGRLPSSGRFRVFLVAFTDLPVGPTNRGQPWREDTWMDEHPREAGTELQPTRAASPDYRLGFYVYEYEAQSPDAGGAFVLSDAALPVATQLERAGLSGLASR